LKLEWEGEIFGNSKAKWESTLDVSYHHLFLRNISAWYSNTFASREIRWVSLVEQALLTLSEHMISSLVLSGVRVSRYLLSCVLLWRLVFVLESQALEFWINRERKNKVVERGYQWMGCPVYKQSITWLKKRAPMVGMSSL
jgi:hypothetical protein